MRINELVKPEELTQFKRGLDRAPRDHNNQVSHDEDVRFALRDYMAKYGFKELGSGAFASVFESPKHKFVLKVFGENPGFLKWIAFCQANPANPYLPRFLGKPIKIHHTYYFIRMERLTHSDPTRQARLSNSLAFLSHRADKLYSGSLDGLKPTDIELLQTELPDYLEDEDIKQAVQAIQSIGKKHFVDINKDNIMFRGNGRGSQPVITDPISG